MPGTFNSGGLNAPPTSIVNYYSAGGTQSAVLFASAATMGTKETLSGALTAATYKEILAVTDSGVLFAAYALAIDTTSRTIGLKIVIDGVTVFDAVTDACTATRAGIVGVGNAVYDAGARLNVVIAPVAFYSSLSVSVKSSLSETDKITLGYLYTTT